MNPKPAATHVALTGAYEADYRRWTAGHTRTTVRAIFWGVVTVIGIAMTTYGLVTWA